MNRVKKHIVILSIVALILVGTVLTVPSVNLVFHYIGYQLFPNMYTTNITVTSGSYEGIAIGSTKRETIVALKNELQHKVYINEDFFESGKSGMLVPLTYSENQKQLLMNRKSYKIYLSRNFADWLELTFNEEDKLVRIQRYKRSFENP